MIYPRCKMDMNQIYITAESFVVPCCWIGCDPHMNLYRELHKDYLSELSLNQRSLDDILSDPRYQKLAASWETEKPFASCQEFCSKPSLKAEHAQGRNEIRTLKLT